MPLKAISYLRCTHDAKSAWDLPVVEAESPVAVGGDLSLPGVGVVHDDKGVSDHGCVHLRAVQAAELGAAETV